MPKKKPTHLYKLKDVSQSHGSTLTYQFSLTSGENGAIELRNLMHKKITALFGERCGGLTVVHVTLSGRLTHITAVSDHTDARACIIDGVAAAYAEHNASASSEKLTTMVTRTVAKFGCQQVTVSYVVAAGWTVDRPDVSLSSTSPVVATHDASTQSVIISTGNPLYLIDDTIIDRIIEALKVSVVKTADVKNRRTMQGLAQAALTSVMNENYAPPYEWRHKGAVLFKGRELIEQRYPTEKPEPQYGYILSELLKKPMRALPDESTPLRYNQRLTINR